MTAKEILIQNGHFPATDEAAQETFFRVCKDGKSEIVKAYIDIGIDVNAYNDFKENALTKAAEGNHVSILEILLAAGARIDDKDNSGDTPLQTAINWKNTEAAKYLVEKGANLNVLNQSSKTPLTRVMDDGNTEMFDFLLENGANPNFAEEKYLSAINNAVSENYYNPYFLDKLLAANANPDTLVNNCQDTLLILAIRKHYNDIAEKLLKKGASPNLENLYGWTPYMVALLEGNMHFAQKIKRFGFDGKGSKTVLYIQACTNENWSEVKKYISEGLNIDTASQDGRTGLMYAVIAREVEEVLWFLENGANINAKQADTLQTALYYAANMGSQELVEIFLEKGANPNDENGSSSALFSAIYNYNNDLGIIQSLVNAGANIDSFSYYNSTLLSTAVSYQHSEIVDFLLKLGANPDIKDEGTQTILCSVVYQKNIELLEMLLKAGANPNIANNYGDTPLHCIASQYKTTEVICGDIAQLLLENGADFSIVDKYGKTPFEKAKSDENPFVHEVIANFTVRQHLKKWNKTSDKERKQFWQEFGKVASIETLKIAMHIQEFEFVHNILLETNISPIEYRKKTSSPLHVAVDTGDKNLVELILSKGANPNYASSYEIYPLSNAVSNRNYEIAEILLKHGANPNLLSYWREAPISTAAGNGDMKMVELLREYGAELQPSPVGWDATMRAAQANQLEMLQYLAKNGANLDMVSDYGYTGLRCAIENGFTEVALFLIENNVRLDLIDYQGNSALNMACGKENLVIIRALIEKGADIYYKNLTGQSVITQIKHHAYLSQELPDIIEKYDDGTQLKRKKVKGFKASEMSVSLLFRAVYNEDFEKVKELIEAGALVNERNYRKDTPLMIAAAKNDIEIGKYLLEKGADVELSNMCGDTAWSYSTLHKTNNLEPFLKEAGAKVDIEKQVDLYDRIAKFGTAIRLGELEKVEEMVVSGKMNLHWLQNTFSPLIYAIQHRNVGAVKLLLSLGADENLSAGEYYPPVYQAITSQSSEILQAIFKQKNLNLNFENTELPLLTTFAIDFEHLEALKLLLKKGATLDNQVIHSILRGEKETDMLKYLLKLIPYDVLNMEMETPLFTYMRESRYEMMKVLLKKGASVNVTNISGHNPLAVAVMLEDKTAIEILLKADANPHGKTPKGVSAYELAKDKPDILAIFK
jgi:ankyrin repeat protein